MIALRIITALALCIIYFLIFTQKVDWFSAFNRAHDGIFNSQSQQQHYLKKAMSGMLFIYAMAAASIALIAYPHEEARWGFLGLFFVIITFISMAGFY